MTKTKSVTTALTAAKSSPRRATGHSAPQRKAKRPIRASSPSSSSGLPANRNTKNEKLLAMLRSHQGTTIAAMMKATGWQKYSVRGFLAGIVRTRLKLDLVSEKPGKDRIYRINEARRSAAKAAPTNSVA